MCSRTASLWVALAWLGLAAAASAQERACAEPSAPAQPGSAQGDAALRADADAARAAAETGELAGLDAELERLAQAAAAQPPAEAAHLQIHLARTWQKLGAREPARAAAIAQRAVALLQQADALASKAGAARLRSYALGYQGELYAAGGRADDALALTRRALYAASRANAPDALYRWQWQLGRLARARGDDDAALASYREALQTLSLLRADLALASAQEAFAFRSEVEPAYLELVDLLLQRASQGDAGARQALLVEARDALESLKAAELRDYFHDACLDAQRRTAPEAVPGAVVLYPVLLPDRVELIVGTSSGLSLFRAPVDGPTLAAEALRLRQLLTKRTTHQYLPLAGQIYDWLIRPAEPALLGPAVSALVVVPSGALRTIPFAALRDARSGEFLIQKVPVAIAPGLTLTDPRPIARAQATGLVAGISKAVQGFEPLPSVPQEVKDVSAVFPGVALLDEQFLAARFESEVAARPIDVLHVASHGEFRGDAAESFVLAWDQKISMDRLASVIGRTRLRTEQPLELLVLSACQTAAGDERAALGLAGVALQAGARSAVATLWSVNDEAAARVIERFYAELGAGASRAQALQRAQRALLETPALRHPAYWAPFLLISSWL
ncbi:MAG TPA: CHAT domain-containing protein [Myxococcota bacterium]|nr:CHAT domain-containing protein [Myxococcota bacterium]